MRISFESAKQADAIALIAELDAYQSALYPPESHHALDLASVEDHGLLFVMARDEAGQALGCGAVVLSAQYGELKRMYVRAQQRGLGVATRILQALEDAAQAAACRVLKLESGPYQLEALALYARCGYTRCERFGSYADDPLSVFMQKTLGGPHA
ncbi:MAG: GNAT family N-acetyltransferase [Pseudomonadota bacterium]